MVNQEQIFFDFRLNLNLFNSDTKKATTIYAVVYYKQKQYRINTGVKFSPSQWNKKRQLAIVSAKRNKLDNYSNTIVNDILKQILLSFEQSKIYFCEHIESIPNLYEVLKQYISPNMATKKHTKYEVPATTQITLVLSTVNKNSTRNIYRGNISIFQRFMDDEKIPDTWTNITYENLEKHKEYLISKKKVVTIINNYLSSLKNILRKAGKDIKLDFHTSGCVIKLKRLRISAVRKKRNPSKSR